MSFGAFFDPFAPPSQSPYRVWQDREKEVGWANEFLDAQRLRGLSLRSLRAYAFDLVNLARWLAVASIELSDLTEGKLTDYIHYQLDRQLQPAPRTINHRLSVTMCLYRFHYGREIPAQRLLQTLRTGRALHAVDGAQRADNYLARGQR